ncbi:MAG: 30S ribosomal protein S6e [Candidatus Hydrothermarchaeaceae archaeon]
MQKIILSNPKTGKSYSIELETEKTKIDGTRIGNTIDASSIGLPGYEIQITGGSDKDGFPMRLDVPGRGRKRVLLSDGPCYKPKSKGTKKRKTVRANIITKDIVQINAKIVKKGAKPIEKLLGVGETKEEKPAEEKEPLKEEKPVKKEKPVKEKKPAEEKKAEEKPPKKEKAKKKEKTEGEAK